MHCTLWTVHRVDAWPVITSARHPVRPVVRSVGWEEEKKDEKKTPSLLLLTPYFTLDSVAVCTDVSTSSPAPLHNTKQKYLSSLVMCRLISCSVLPSQHQKRRVTHILISHFHFSPQKERERRDGERGHTTPHHLLVHSAQAAQLSSSAKTRPRQKS